jgi:uncharacterized membrane protein
VKRREDLTTPRAAGRVGVSYDSDTFGRFSESIANFLGTARFLVWQTGVITFWILFNTVIPARFQFDPWDRGLVLLTLVLSIQASYAAPLILLAQSRQERRDRVTAQNDREVAERTQADTEFLAREIASVRLTMSDMVTGEAFDDRLDRLTEVVERLASRVELLAPAGKAATVRPTSASEPSGIRADPLRRWHAGELLQPHAQLTHGAQHADGVELGVACPRDSARESPGGGLHGKGRGGGCRCGADQFGDTDDRGDPSAGFVGTSNLDTDGSDTTFAVRRTEHRQPGGEPVAPIGRHAGGDAVDLGERVVQQQRRGHLRSVAVVGTDRLGKPAQLAPGAGRRVDPAAVEEPERAPAQRPVVSAGTGGSGRAVDRDVDLVTGRQLGCRETGEQSGQARRHPRPHDQRDTCAACCVVEVDHRPHVGEVVAHRHDGDAPFDEPLDDVDMGTALRQDHHVDIRGKCPTDTRIMVDHRDAGDHRRQTSADPLSDDPTAYDRNLGHQESGNSSGRQPPCWGGVPPEPLTRSTAAANPMRAMAENARRRNFIRSAG